jgi:hypothetical protein
MDRQIEGASAGDTESCRLLFELAPMCLFVVDAQGRVLKANRAARRLVCAEGEQEIRGLRLLDCFDGCDAEQARGLIEGPEPATTGEIFLRAPPGGRRYRLAVTVLPIGNPAGPVTRLIGLQRAIAGSGANPGAGIVAESVAAPGGKVDFHIKRMSSAGLISDVEQRVCRRISASLHDAVGQPLQAIKLGLAQLRRVKWTPRQRHTELLDQLIAEVGVVLHEIRAVCRELRPVSEPPLKLAEAIRRRCNALNARTPAAIMVQGDDAAALGLAEHARRQCLFALSEALSNAVRHARARTIDVVMASPTANIFSVCVRDDGIGFDLGDIGENTGLGLTLIRERAESVGGSARIESKPGNGTLVELYFPIALVSVGALTLKGEPVSPA